VETPPAAPRPHEHLLVRRAIRAGWVCVALSALFLYLSGPTARAPAQDYGVLWATYLMLARLFGIGSFAIGTLAVFNQRWFVGISLLLLSVVLPVIAYRVHGTI